MRIGVDARPLCGHINGVGRYLAEVVKGLTLANNTTIILYTYEEVHAHFNVDDVRIRFIQPPPLIPRVLRPFWWLYWALPKAIKQDAPDVFWSARHALPQWGNPLIPQIVTINDLVCYKYPETMTWKNLIAERLFMPRSVKRATHVITISQATKDQLIKKFSLSDSDITVIHLAPSFDKLTEQPENLSFENLGKNFILFVGTLEPRKNVTRLLDAYLRLPQELQRKHKLVLVGGIGWRSGALHQRIQALEHRGSIMYLGYLSDKEILYLMSKALMLVYPSLYEGFGLPIVDAMKVGLPLLTSTDSACKEVSGYAAVHVDPLDVADISKNLGHLLNDELLREKLSSLGKQRSKHFSWKKTAEAHKQVFTSCINKWTK